MTQRDASISVQSDLTIPNVLSVQPDFSTPQSIQNELTRCNLQTQLNSPVVFQVSMKNFLSHESTLQQLAHVFQLLDQQSRQGIQILLSFPSQ